MIKSYLFGEMSLKPFGLLFLSSQSIITRKRKAQIHTGKTTQADHKHAWKLGGLKREKFPNSKNAS